MGTLDRLSPALSLGFAPTPAPPQASPEQRNTAALLTDTLRGCAPFVQVPAAGEPPPSPGLTRLHTAVAVLLRALAPWLAGASVALRLFPSPVLSLGLSSQALSVGQTDKL